jgi:hypothetical protein
LTTARQFLRTAERAAIACSILATGSCVGGGAPTGVTDEVWEGTLSPRFALIPSAADAWAATVNRIRAVALRASDGAQVGGTQVDVSPTADSWLITLGVSTWAPADSIIVFVYLLHVTPDGSESVEFSGRSRPLEVTAGQVVSPDVPIVRGPIANLSTTSVTITSAPSTMPAGASVLLTSTATSSDGAAPTVFWTSLDTSVVRLSGATATALSPGVTQVVASAGAFADTAAVTVVEVLQVTTASLPDGMAGDPYSVTLAATGGSGPYTWSLAATGGLPSGLTLSGTGDLTGTPTIAGAFDFSVEVTSGDGQVAQRMLSLTIAPAPVVLLPTELCSAYPPSAIATFADANFDAAVRSALGLAPQDDLTCQALTGLQTLRDSGGAVLSMVGAQNLTGLDTLALRNSTIDDLTPIGGLTDLRVLDFTGSSITDFGPLAGMTGLTALWIDQYPQSDLGAVVGLTGLTDLHVDGGVLSDVGGLSSLAALSSLSLPGNAITDVSPLAGLTALTVLDLSGNSSLSDVAALLANAGLGTGDDVDLSGTGVSCTDVAALIVRGATVAYSCTFPTLAITTSSLPSGAVGAGYSQALAATGGSGLGYQWSLVSGALPSGLTLDSSSGSIVGVPTTAENATFRVQVTSPGDLGQSAEVDLSIDVAAPAVGDLIGRWVDATGNPISAASVGARVRLQLCYANPAIAAFQGSIRGFAGRATAVSITDLDSAAGTGVHPDCVGVQDVLSTGFTASGLVDPIAALIVSSSAGPGTGSAGIFEITFDLTASGLLQVDVDPASIVASDFSGNALAATQSIFNLNVN